MAEEKEKQVSPVLKDMQDIGFYMGLMGKGEDYLIDIEAPPEILRQYMETYNRGIAKIAAQRLGIEDANTLIYEKDRTPEQSELMLQISAYLQRQQVYDYIRSNYFSSFQLMLETFSEAMSKTVDEIGENDDLSGACILANRYFYATHKEIKPEAPAALDDANKEEIKQLVSAVLHYQKANNCTMVEAFMLCFKLKNEQPPEMLTEISRADHFFLPISKAYQKEHDIALEGVMGREINVGNKTAAGEVKIVAQISDMEGNPLNITDIQKGVQRAIGNLINEAGGKEALPITVSPAQIYRAYARLPFDAMVTAQQEAEMEAAMKTLMYAPSSINFKAQLEKHKKIKKQDDYDYEGEAAGKLEGNLVQAQKLEGTAKNGARVVAYKIYDFPVFYMYSHVVGQMAWLPNILLTGTPKPAEKREKAEAQEGVQYVAIKEKILTRIVNMKREQKQKKHETPPAIIRADEIANDLGIELTRQRERTLLKNIALYLDDLKKQKQIKGYKETKEGRKIAGYTIIL